MRVSVLAFGSGALAAVVVACSTFGSGTDEHSTADASVAEASAGDEGEPTPTCDPAATSSDAKNCGRCGHDCLGGACTAGVCQPVQIGTSSDAPVLAVAVGATHVVWMTATHPSGGNGYVYACPKAGCAGAPTVVVANKMSGMLAGNGSVVYASLLFGDNGFVRIEGDSPVDVPTLAPHKALLRLATHGSTLYVDAFGESPGAQSRSIFAFTEPSTETKLGVFSGDDDAGVVNTGPFVVTDKAMFLGAVNTGRIVRSSLDGAGVWTDFLNDDSSYAYSMATDDKRLFWTPGPDGHVYGCGVDTPACSGKRKEIGPNVLGNDRAAFLTVHGETLYVTTTGGDVLACDTTSCGATVRKLAHETSLTTAFASFAEPLAADDVSVYYVAVDATDGGADGGSVSRIMRVAR